jgi:predicted PurR-regulated permease PerM
MVVLFIVFLLGVIVFLIKEYANLQKEFIALSDRYQREIENSNELIQAIIDMKNEIDNAGEEWKQGNNEL